MGVIKAKKASNYLTFLGVCVTEVIVDVGNGGGGGGNGGGAGGAVTSTPE